MSDKSSDDDERKKRKIAFLPWKIIFGNIFGFGLVAAFVVSAIYIVQACHPKPKLQILEIEEDPTTGKIVLKGFNPEATQEQIIKELGDTLTIPEQVQVIAEDAFFKNGKSIIPSEITKLDWGQSNIEEIGANAFKNAPFEQELVIPNNVKINAGAFYGCKHITKVTLPENTDILGESDNGAFQGCENLTEIDVSQWNQTPPEGKWIDAFKGVGDTGVIYIKGDQLAQQWREFFTNKFGFVFDIDHWRVFPDSEWVVTIETNHPELVVGSGAEKWHWQASWDKGVTVKFNVVDDAVYKVKSKDLTVKYNNAVLKGVTIENIGTSYTFTVDPSQLIYGITYMSFYFEINEYYDVHLDRGVDVKEITICDIPVDYPEGATFAGTVEGVSSGNQLCLDNCYAIWGNKTDPTDSIKLWGEDAFIYNPKYRDKFTLKTPTGFASDTKEVTIHLDESKEPRWTNIDETEAVDHIYLGLEENNFSTGKIQFNYNTENGYRLDKQNTIVIIDGTEYPLNDSQHPGVFELKNNKLMIHPKVVLPNATPDIAIKLNVAVLENDFACSVEYEDATKFSTSDFEVVTALDFEDVVIKVKPITNWQVVSDDTSRLYATITLKSGTTLTVTELTVGEVGDDGKTPITMSYLSQEWVGQIDSVQFFVAADQTS